MVIVSQGELPFDTVLIDNEGGARRLAEDLVLQGYTRFAIVEGSGALLTSRDRVRGFLDGLQAHGIDVPEALRVSGEFTRDGGYYAAGELIERGLDDVDLVFAVNDVMAIGVLARLRAASIAVPSRIAVAGFDDISTASAVSPALTTVHLHIEQIGAAALELALATRSANGRSVVQIDGSVVQRESTPQR